MESTSGTKGQTTGLIYDERMLNHKCLWEDHPERPERCTSILERCQELGLINRCKLLKSNLATESQLISVHPLDHIKKLRSICSTSKAVTDLEEFCTDYDSIYVNPNTYEAGLLAAGSAITLTNSILSGQVKNGMAIIRPPGHHAMINEYCGYCFFNNVGLAAKDALDSGSASKILIVDFDVHHGQGTQEIFYDDPRVLYFSTHRYEHGKFWPNLKESNYNWIGSKQTGAQGYNINVPLNAIAMGNDEFLTIWHQLLIPIAYQFNPDLVLVSAGFDAALNDPKGQMCITPQCYPHLISPLMGLAGGKLGIILEGGYCLKALAEGASLCLRTLLGDPCPIIQPIKCPMPELSDTILNLFTLLEDYWTLVIPTNLKHDVHVPSLKYEWTNPKLLKYPIKNPNPVSSFEQASSPAEAELEALIKSTDSSVPKYKIGLVCDDANYDLLKSNGDGIDNNNKCMRITSAKTRINDNDYVSINSILKLIMKERICQSGIIITEPNATLNTNTIMCQIALNDYGVTRLLLININHNGTNILNNDSHDPRILEININHQSPEEVSSTKSSNNNNSNVININLPPPSSASTLNNNSFLVSLLIFTKLILPVAYEFGPELILINDNENNNGGATASVNLGLLLQLLSPLANGRLIVTLPKHDNDDTRKRLELYFKILLGETIITRKPQNIEKKKPAPAVDKKIIECLTSILDIESKYWTVLSPFRKNVPSSKSCSILLGDYNE